MKLDELRDWVETMSEEFPDDTEILVAMHPSWPFEYSVNLNWECQVNDGKICLFSEARQLGYLSGSFANEIGWNS